LHTFLKIEIDNYCIRNPVADHQIIN